MSKSKSHSCRHPRTAVSADVSRPGTNAIEYTCKKCGGVWTEVEARGVVPEPSQ